jgi:tripartite-type tricarboxylate transporter receptor subunit TctC
MNMAKASYRGRDSITLLGGSNIMFELRTCDWLRLSALGCVLLAVTHTAVAQSFPSRALTLVVPFAAGGPSDVAGRIVAQGLSEKLGQQVVVENPAGAGGTLGSLRVAKAPPDGYQFVIGNSDSPSSSPRDGGNR